MNSEVFCRSVKFSRCRCRSHAPTCTRKHTTELSSVFFFVSSLPGHQPAAGQRADPRDPGLPGERAGGEGPEEALQPGAEESAAGRVPAGECPQVEVRVLVPLEFLM